MSDPRFLVRHATPADAEAIAAAHVASIRSLGAQAYDPATVEAWGAPRDGSRYRAAMEHGEVFFLALRRETGSQVEAALGFSSYRLEAGKHRTAIYVRGGAARAGVGRALFRAAEGEARSRGADELHVDASLAALAFYRANGFEELGPGEHVLPGGRRMACVFMRKVLARTP
jgi:putative acetyltransferase